MKKLIAILLAAAMCVPMLCINAFAAADYKVKLSRTYGSGYTYVTLTSADGDIYYTTDGTKPTRASAEYTGKIKVTEPSTLRIAVYDNGVAQKRYSSKIDVKVKYPTYKLSGTENGKYVYTVSVPSGARVYYTTDGTTPYTNNGTKLTGSKITAAPGTTLKLVAIKGGWIKSVVRTIKVPAAVSGGSTGGSSSGAQADFESEVLRLVNVERAKYGLTALQSTAALDKAAQQRAEELVSSMSHTRPDGRSCFTILSDNGISYYYAGENVAGGQTTPEKVVEGWMGSEGHRANILNANFKYLGVGYVKANTGYKHYWAQEFIG